MQGTGLVDQAAPQTVYAWLREDAETLLVDVRTRAEWTFVGVPDLSTIGRGLLTVEWLGFPGMEPNARFYESVLGEAGGRLPGTLFFICRSGQRSLAAARLVQQRAQADGVTLSCINVAEGFEGDLDAEGHRGRVNGWKVAGLPWRQT